ncbi:MULTISPECIES: LytR/AlgR family response regulator transcription factor [Flavobacterium]|jgi:DNA-binding LytR/AlgR family response regulator|uniref:Two component transcriptional regulator, LytTR family n=1 Tax=Flavobacterium johnsoniae (strain ATCC 17061 / DSM 2064 / JCM 8514 / BCRC 14874 / CCUG 350202 / NBRC 14942 / NCIMB 11054 / UW101) TaxID=376686 RepID=A5FCC1_FLAJ1|nr:MULTISPECIES: LytTR family DNA-binding domain-containing protein [Flavobacterium]ABQ07142.1 two component transcriptional regulator, LytTR family [Flavobacterium johnsoniae UW101]OXE98857.1 DNA-binding response regulator [Flavobacterium johnsoniae UW101]WDF57870.1 LytTR family DNA-binding domain-containing protein [Flavobacterium sp. KACC 22758]WQG81019.1 LytTR family DNA-binding domain-containing protein [Flavobacterium johnsoniae UW101]SHL29156.1 two component transcriptional regulator, L
MTTLKCIAVDDEPLALKLVETFIDQTPFLQLSASCDNAVEAMSLIREKQPDLVFLDINMPNLTGMELARLLQEQPGQVPKIVFTTAYNHYAIEGYKVNAVDYLLKPFSYEEFLRAANKVLQITEEASNNFQPITADDEFIFLKVEYQWVRISLKEILYIESLKDYVKVHLDDNQKAILSLISLKALEEKLPSAKFMRVHRSFIVSLDKINAISKNSIFIDKTEITVGEQYKETFKTIVDKWLK